MATTQMQEGEKQMSEGEFKKRILYEGRTFIDLYYERESRFKELEEHGIECHPDPLMDDFLSREKLEQWLDEARKELLSILTSHQIYGKTGEIDVASLMHFRVVMGDKIMKWFGDEKK